MRTFLEHSFRGLAYFLIDKNYRTFIRLAILLGDRKRYKPTTTKINGHRLSIPDGPSFLWQYYEVFFKEIYKFESQTNTPIIFDCGANIGTASIYFKSIFPDAVIHAFEPDPKIFGILEQNIRDNGYADIQLYQKAVWKNNDFIEFGSEGSDSGSILTKTENVIKIKTIRLKDHIQNVGTVDFLKMDIEGAEVEVIKDCEDVLHKCNNIFIEFHSFDGQNQQLEDILDILRKNNFRYYIEGIMKRKKPFINKKAKTDMDNQIIICAYQM